MVKALFDTNILIDLTKGIDDARREVELYEDLAISIITVIEVLVGALPESEALERGLLADFDVISLDDSVAEEAARLRRAHRLKLPDAIIWASARTTDRLLVTRNTKDFPVNDPGVRHPYAI
jgi:hypothetical protein